MRTALQALVSALFGLALLALLLFLPAGTFFYWQAWVFIGVFTLATLIPSIYLAVRNPVVLQRRMRVGPGAESRPVQKVVIVGAFVMSAVVLVVCALDHRFGWSRVPVGATVTGTILVAAGLLIAQLAVIQNDYAASNVTVEAGQTVVASGLYGAVRHPLYLGAVIMMIGIPLSLGSYWGFVALLPGTLVLVVRILDEERMLTDSLAGYADYTRKVRYRLVPLVW